MIQIVQIATANTSALLLLGMLKIHMERKTKRNDLLDVRILSIMISLTMFQCFFDTLVFWIDGRSFPMARELNYAGNVLYYILNVTIAFFWPLFMEYKLNNSSIRVKKLALLFSIPYCLCVGLVASAPFNGFVFTVTEDNRYVRTSWHFLIPTVLILFYVLFGTAKVYIHRRNEGKYMLFPAVYFITPTLLAVITQSLYYGISLIFIGIAIGLTGVYLSTQNESAYLDQLCGVYNRRYFNDYIRAFCNSRSKTSVTGVLIDMDDFKEINDRLGHAVGDEALIQFSEVLRRHMNGIGFAARYGGDEFILLFRQPASMAQAAVTAIEKELDELNAADASRYRLAFSYGIAEITAEGSVEDFLKWMDNRMYAMKKERKVER